MRHYFLARDAKCQTDSQTTSIQSNWNAGGIFVLKSLTNWCSNFLEDANYASMWAYIYTHAEEVWRNTSQFGEHAVNFGDWDTF
jgi:hypothetical protein